MELFGNHASVALIPFSLLPFSSYIYFLPLSFFLVMIFLHLSPTSFHCPPSFVLSHRTTPVELRRDPTAPFAGAARARQGRKGAWRWGRRRTVVPTRGFRPYGRTLAAPYLHPSSRQCTTFTLLPALSPTTTSPCEGAPPLLLPILALRPYPRAYAHA